MELERVVSLSVSTNDGGGGHGAPGGAGGGRRQAAHLTHVPVLANDTSVALTFQPMRRTPLEPVYALLAA